MNCYESYTEINLPGNNGIEEVFRCVFTDGGQQVVAISSCSGRLSLGPSFPTVKHNRMHYKFRFVTAIHECTMSYHLFRYYCKYPDPGFVSVVES